MHIHASLEQCKLRCEKRAQSTGRYISEELLSRVFTECEISFERLKSKVNLVKEYDNNGTIPFLLETKKNHNHKNHNNNYKTCFPNGFLN